MKPLSVAFVSCLALVWMSSNAPAAEVKITIAGLKYKPAVVEIKAGDTVIWTNDDEADHTVTSNDKSFDSGNLGNGQAFEQKFDKPGEYAYHCAYHPRMKGKIVVKKS